jgi:sec-independent protein translocase protein TatB
MFNIGAGEMVLILVAALLVLGPQRLPELARAIGKFMREFRRQTDEVRNVVEREFYSMDQDLNREPPPRPGPRFGAPQDHAPVPVPALPETNTLVPSSELQADLQAEPSLLPPGSAASTLGLDAARLPEPVAVEGTPASPDADPSLVSPATPVPIPGTVARNAPKRS